MGMSPAQAAGPKVCIDPHVSGIGQTGAVCNTWDTYYYAGTVGQNRAIEGARISIHGLGRVCLDAHVRNVGWQGERCFGDGAEIWVGTSGENRPMEALRIRLPDGGIVKGMSHVQNLGWLDEIHGGYIQLGTVGNALNLEALAVVPVAGP